MRKTKWRILATAGVITWSIFSATVTTSKADPVYIEPVRMRVTCYLPTGNQTADGAVPYEGICAAKREWMGKTAILYDEEMRLIGFFEIRDTGGAERIQDGACIDIFRNDMEAVNDWISRYGDYCFVQILDAAG